MNEPPGRDTSTTQPYDEQIFAVPDLIDGERIVLHAERLAPYKRRVVDRVAKISKRVVVVRKRVEVEVEVLQEELSIQYEPGHGQDTIGDTPLDVRIVLYAEHPEVVKVVRPVEEIRVTTRAETEVRTFGDTVRHEVLDVKPTRIA